MIPTLEPFKNKHKGETCYIFGDGPSIKEFDYKRLKKYPAICCGMQAFHRDFENINVQYYSLIEPYLFYPDWMIFPKKLQYLKKHRIIIDHFRKIIPLKKEITFFVNLSNLFAIRKSNVEYAHRYLLKKNRDFHKFYKEGIDPFAGSFNATLSLALLMGFKKVFLIGFDAFTIQQSPYRWYEKNLTREVNPLNYTNYRFLELYKEDMEIFNISNQGTMCNLENEDYFLHTGHKPVFRENHELIAKESLELIQRRFVNGY